MLGESEAAKGCQGRDAGAEQRRKPEEEESDVSVNAKQAPEVRSTGANGVLSFGLHEIPQHGLPGGTHRTLCLVQVDTFVF